MLFGRTCVFQSVCGIRKRTVCCSASTVLPVSCSHSFSTLLEKRRPRLASRGHKEPTRTMKLLTHNMLTSKCIKGVQEGYPLQLKVEDLEVKESEFNQEFIARLLPKIRYEAVYSAAKDAGKSDDLPSELPEDAATSEEFLRKLHHILLEVEILKGELVCPETGRVFPIQNGIPNMLLTPEESEAKK